MSIARIDWRDRQVDIEYQWIDPDDGTAVPDDAPPIVFLHEGLGSLAMWKDFPRRLCQAAGQRGLVWSRPGYGGSSPRDADEHWDVDFLQRQADEVLPALLTVLGVERPVWLFGHSDGASIALIRAAHAPPTVAGATVLAPHIFVEELSLRSIAATRELYRAPPAADGRPGLRARLARYHDDVDSAFWGWNDIWLDPRFRQWTIEAALASIRCPLLVIQGVDDEYGTMAQVDGIIERVAQAHAQALPACRHSPHVDQPDAVIAATVRQMQAAASMALPGL